MSKEGITDKTQSKENARYPIYWIMDTYLSTLDPASNIAIQINLLLVEYELKCSRAQTELLEAVHKLMEEELKMS